MSKLCIVSLCVMMSISIYSQQFIDTDTPLDAKPQNTNISGNWKLDFSDEFSGTVVDATKWNIDNSTNSRAARPNIGITDWRWKPSNVSVENGNLVLKVYKTGANSMTNGSVNSSGKYLTKYGYFEARIQIADLFKGTHTAFWMQSPNMGNVDGTANDGAEIDIFESAFSDQYTKAVVHIDGYGTNHQANTVQYNTPNLNTGYHTWGFHWTEEFMTIYYDGVKKVTYGSGSNYKWVVRALEYLWLSNGASFGLSGNQYFVDFPIGYLTEAKVDYFRVWKEIPNALEYDDTANNKFLNTINISPNPISGREFTIDIESIEERSAEVFVCDMNGKFYSSYNLYTGKNSIKLPKRLPTGVYLLKIVNGNKSKVEKLVAL